MYKIGCQIKPEGFYNDNIYLNLIAQHFDYVCPLHDLNETWHSEINTHDFLIDVNNWAKVHNKSIRGHSIIDGCLIGDDLRQELETRPTQKILLKLIKKIHKLNSLIDRAKEWDVANECFDYDGMLRENAWKKNLGNNYLFRVFDIVKQTNANWKLFYCDFSIKNTLKWDAIYTWCKEAKKLELIDGVAIQLQFIAYPQLSNVVANNLKYFAISNNSPSIPYGYIKDTIHKFQDLGLIVRVPETTIWNRKIVTITSNTFEFPWRNFQAEAYHRLTDLFLECNLTEIGYWSPFDKYQWCWDDKIQCNPGFWDTQYQLKEFAKTLVSC